MARIVQKFGGTSLADLDRIRAVAKLIKGTVKNGDQVAVVVSAMAGATNQLIQWTCDLSPNCDPREYDVVVSTGEQVTVGLLTMALQKLGVEARSWLGWQLPIRTDNLHGKARIQSMCAEGVINSLELGQVSVMAGFQGIAANDRIATLGRGGSDTSAVALAAAISADRCDIYTDVEGIYTSDPRIVTKAKKLSRITYEEMLELASLGAKVLQARSVELAMNQRVRLQVLSSFIEVSGTLVVDEEEIVEKEIVSGIAHSENEAKITLVGVSDNPGIAAGIFGPLAEANINVDMIVQNVSKDGEATDLTFTVPKDNMLKAIEVLECQKEVLGFERVIGDPDVVKISVVGVGMRSHAGVANKMFQTLAEKGINIQVISTSEIKISVLVSDAYMELALRSLHTAYDLDEM